MSYSVVLGYVDYVFFFFFKQKAAYEMRSSDWSSDVCSSDLLIETENIPAEKIAVATGDQRGLDGIDLFDPACPIEHVITMEALKEGWDCSFAYVFCSVSRIQSAADVEQLLGRVLRMP